MSHEIQTRSIWEWTWWRVNNPWINYSLKGFSGGQVCWDLHVYGKLNCDKHEPRHNNCVVSHAQNDMMRTLFVCLCVGYLSVQPVCVCVCVCVCEWVYLLSVQRPVESTCSCQWWWKGHSSLSLLIYKRIATLHIQHLPAIYPMEQENTHNMVFN